MEYVNMFTERLRNAQGIVGERIHNRLSIYNKPKAIIENLSPAALRQCIFNAPPKYKEGDKVLVYTPVIDDKKSRKLAHFWKGPYEIRRVINPVVYEIKIGSKNQAIHVERLATFHERGSI